MLKRIAFICFLVGVSGNAVSSFAQQTPKCHGAPIVRIDGDSRQLFFHFEQHDYKLFPLDAVADYDEACHETSRLFIVAGADVPFHIMLEAAGNIGKLEIEKARIFVRVRDHYNELTVGDPLLSIPEK